jgi:hypothetical protein
MATDEFAFGTLAFAAFNAWLASLLWRSAMSR